MTRYIVENILQKYVQNLTHDGPQHISEKYSVPSTFHKNTVLHKIFKRLNTGEQLGIFKGKGPIHEKGTINVFIEDTAF